MEVEGPERPAGPRAAPRSRTVASHRARDLLRRVAAACDRVPPSSWVRPGTPLPLLAVALWLVPFMVAGIIRYVTGLKLGISLAVAIPAVMVLGALWWPRPRAAGGRPDRDARLFTAAGAVIGVGLVAWAFALLYSPDLGAMPSYYGPDGGTHMVLQHTFADSDPKVYAGFISLYATAHLLDRMFSLAPPGALALAFYSAVAAVVVVPIIAMMALLQSRRGERGPRWVGLAAFSAAWSWCLKDIALPVLSNIQVDGFYGHFFVFLPFALAWVADVLVTPILLRIFWTGLVVVLCRFTYGLNLGDLLLTCGILWIFDGLGSRRRAIPFLAGAGAVAAGIVAYVNLAPVFVNGGYVEVYGFVALPKIMRSAVLALGAYSIVEAVRRTRAGDSMEQPAPIGLLRVVRFPLLFAAVCLVAYEQLSKIPRVENYYRLKYPLMPVTFLGAAASIAVGYTALILMKRLSRPLVGVAAFGAILVFGSLSVQTNEALAVLQDEMAERSGPKPHVKLRPLVDPKVWKTIETTLRRERKAFGGYVSAYFPGAHFLNGWMGFDQIWQVFYPPKLTPGHCVFWSAAADDEPVLYSADRVGIEATRTALEANPLKVCETYNAPWVTARRRVCHTCY